MEVLICPDCKQILIRRRGVYTEFCQHVGQQHGDKVTSEYLEEAESLAGKLLYARDAFYWPEAVK